MAQEFQLFRAHLDPVRHLGFLQELLQDGEQVAWLLVPVDGKRVKHRAVTPL